MAHDAGNSFFFFPCILQSFFPFSGGESFLQFSLGREFKNRICDILVPFSFWSFDAVGLNLVCGWPSNLMVSAEQFFISIY